MNFITINNASCNHCGSCVQACPVALLNQAPGKPPHCSEKEIGRCIRCGHCVAVCPQAALSHSQLDRADFSPVPANKIEPEGLEALLLSRRSVRDYKKAPVARQQIEKLLEVAAKAPTASNSQKISWSVISGKEHLEQIKAMTLAWIALDPARAYHLEAAEQGRDVVLRGATSVLVAHGPADYRWTEMDSSIALTQLELFAVSMGIGTCWGGLITAASSQNAKLLELLGVPEASRVGGILMIGQPKQKHYLVPPRNKAKVTWL